MACVRCCCGGSGDGNDTRIVHTESVYTDVQDEDDPYARPDIDTFPKLHSALCPPTAPLRAGEEFLVRLDVNSGTSLGVGVTMADREGTMLKVASVQKDGAVHQWNQLHRYMQLEVGDTIRQINDVKGSVHAMIKECVKVNSFVLRVRKQR